jgi:hypothetical protein
MAEEGVRIIIQVEREGGLHYKGNCPPLTMLGILLATQHAILENEVQPGRMKRANLPVPEVQAEIRRVIEGR